MPNTYAPPPKFTGWNQGFQEGQTNAANVVKMLTQADLQRAQAAAVPSEIAYRNAQVENLKAEHQRKVEADKMRDEANKRTSAIQDRRAGIMQYLAELRGSPDSPENRIRALNAAKALGMLDEQIDRDNENRWQWGFSQGLPVGATPPARNARTADQYLKELGFGQGTPNPPIPAWQSPQQPATQQPTAQQPQPIAQGVPRVRAIANEQLPQNTTGEITAIPENEVGAAQDAGITVRQPATVPQPPPLFARPKDKELPEHLKAMPIPARIKAYDALMQELPQQKNTIDRAISNLYDIRYRAEEIKHHPNIGVATGVTSVLGNLPGALSLGARDVRKLADSLGATQAFAMLGELRQQSKTGGALGQVSDREEQMLKDAIASLDLSQREEAVKQATDKISRHVMNLARLYKSSFERTYAEKLDLPSYDDYKLNRTREMEQLKRGNTGKVKFLGFE